MLSVNGATGSVVPRKEIDIVPQVSGIIDELYIVAGDFCKKESGHRKNQDYSDMVNLNKCRTTRMNRAKIKF